ncbi:MAG: two-component system, cell cycle response regulator [Solirubrobacteraceae bacterium]|jgi:diguanylate cyclase (GGDEF)-like protein|nr:two-component system, cell cycle response regulator [Solirubrobacteraceae bacterium]MEA2288729.1 two-component system, cell cycle response regulator [Solirubrobacteraceae bacterium]
MRLVITEGSLNGTRVLLAHSRDAARRAMREVLEPLGSVVDEADGVDDALTAARAVPPDVLLLDRELGDVLPEVKGDPDLFGIAVVLVGEPPDVPSVLAALERGAHDVLREDAPAPELIARVRAAWRAKQMHDQLLTREHDLETLAYHDELTGLPNRRFALRQLHALLSRSRRHDLDLSVLLVDADRFKSLNDRHGHLAGDDVLRGLAERLRQRVREEDIVARYGGEEFLVILPDTTPEGAEAVAEDLREAVAAQPFPIGRFALPVTVSVGWATWQGERLESLLARADRGLYAAKDAGRDCVRQDPQGAEAGSR